MTVGTRRNLEKAKIIRGLDSATRYPRRNPAGTIIKATKRRRPAKKRKRNPGCWLLPPTLQTAAFRVKMRLVRTIFAPFPIPQARLRRKKSNGDQRKEELRKERTMGHERVVRYLRPPKDNACFNALLARVYWMPRLGHFVLVHPMSYFSSVKIVFSARCAFAVWCIKGHEKK